MNHERQRTARITQFKAFRGSNFRAWRKSYCALQKEKNSWILIFTVPDQSAKNAKIMRLENLALYGIHSHLIIVNENGGIV